jgi:hypothetical protein
MTGATTRIRDKKNVAEDRFGLKVRESAPNRAWTDRAKYRGGQPNALSLKWLRLAVYSSREFFTNRETIP